MKKKTMMTRNVYIVTCHRNVLKNCLKRVPIQTPFFWIYLGKDIFKSKKIEELIGTIAERVNIGEDLQEVARIYRQDYIDYIGKLSLEYDTPLWFLTSLSEKNPFVSDFFLHFCYVKICQKRIFEQSNNLIIVCENRGIFNSLWENLQNYPQINIVFYDSRFSQIIDNLFSLSVRVKNKLVFLLRYLLRVALAKIFSAVMRHSTGVKDDDPVIIMHSWTDYRSFSQQSDYKEVYLGDVGDGLEKSENNFIYLADILPTMWYPKALYNLCHVNKKIYLMEEFLSFGDVIASLTFVQRNYPNSKTNSFFDEVEVGTLLSHEFVKDRSSFRPEQSYLNYFISQRILHRFTVRSFLFTFENHIWEKVFCEGFKRNPKIKTMLIQLCLLIVCIPVTLAPVMKKNHPPFRMLFLLVVSKGKKN